MPYELALIVANIALVIVTLAYVIINAKILSSQNRALEYDKRPFLDVNTYTSNVENQGILTLLKIQLRNYGKTPARDVNLTVKLKTNQFEEVIKIINLPEFSPLIFYPKTEISALYGRESYEEGDTKSFEIIRLIENTVLKNKLKEKKYFLVIEGTYKSEIFRKVYNLKRVFSFGLEGCALKEFTEISPEVNY